MSGSFDDNYNFDFGFQQPQPQYYQPRTYTWHEAWTHALTTPQEATFWWLIRDPLASVGRATMWLSISLGIYAVCGAIAQLIFFSLYKDLLFANQEFFLQERSTAGTILVIPFQVILALIIVLLVMMVQHVVAHALGGRATLEQTIYGLSTIVAPLAVISGVLSFIPFAGVCLWFFLVFYGFVVTIVALRGIHMVGWVQAFIAALSPLGIGFGFCFCCAMCVASVA